MKRSLAVLKPEGHYAHILSPGTDQNLLAKTAESSAEGEGPSVGRINVTPNAHHLDQVCSSYMSIFKLWMQPCLMAFTDIYIF
jgi:hypothetical protein